MTTGAEHPRSAYDSDAFRPRPAPDASGREHFETHSKPDSERMREMFDRVERADKRAIEIQQKLQARVRNLTAEIGRTKTQEQESLQTFLSRYDRIAKKYLAIRLDDGSGRILPLATVHAALDERMRIVGELENMLREFEQKVHLESPSPEQSALETLTPPVFVPEAAERTQSPVERLYPYGWRDGRGTRGGHEHIILSFSTGWGRDQQALASVSGNQGAMRLGLPQSILINNIRGQRPLGQEGTERGFGAAKYEADEMDDNRRALEEAGIEVEQTPTGTRIRVTYVPQGEYVEIDGEKIRGPIGRAPGAHAAAPESAPSTTEQKLPEGSYRTRYDRVTKRMYRELKQSDGTYVRDETYRGRTVDEIRAGMARGDYAVANMPSWQRGASSPDVSAKKAEPPEKKPKAKETPAKKPAAPSSGTKGIDSKPAAKPKEAPKAAPKPAPADQLQAALKPDERRVLGEFIQGTHEMEERIEKDMQTLKDAVRDSKDPFPSGSALQALHTLDASFNRFIAEAPQVFAREFRALLKDKLAHPAEQKKLERAIDMIFDAGQRLAGRKGKLPTRPKIDWDTIGDHVDELAEQIRQELAVMQPALKRSMAELASEQTPLLRGKKYFDLIVDDSGSLAFQERAPRKSSSTKSVPSEKSPEPKRAPVSKIPETKTSKPKEAPKVAPKPAPASAAAPKLPETKPKAKEAPTKKPAAPSSGTKGIDSMPAATKAAKPAEKPKEAPKPAKPEKGTEKKPSAPKAVPAVPPAVKSKEAPPASAPEKVEPAPKPRTKPETRTETPVDVDQALTKTLESLRAYDIRLAVNSFTSKEARAKLTVQDVTHVENVIGALSEQDREALRDKFIYFYDEDGKPEESAIYLKPGHKEAEIKTLIETWINHPVRKVEQAVKKTHDVLRKSYGISLEVNIIMSSELRAKLTAQDVTHVENVIGALSEQDREVLRDKDISFYDEDGKPEETAIYLKPGHKEAEIEVLVKDWIKAHATKPKNQ